MARAEASSPSTIRRVAWRGPQIERPPGPPRRPGRARCRWATCQAAATRRRSPAPGRAATRPERRRDVGSDPERLGDRTQRRPRRRRPWSSATPGRLPGGELGGQQLAGLQHPRGRIGSSSPSTAYADQPVSRQDRRGADGRHHQRLAGHGQRSRRGPAQRPAPASPVRGRAHGRRPRGCATAGRAAAPPRSTPRRRRSCGRARRPPARAAAPPPVRSVRRRRGRPPVRQHRDQPVGGPRRHRDLAEPARGRRAAGQVQHDVDGRRELAVRRRPVQARGQGQRLDPGRYVERRSWRAGCRSRPRGRCSGRRAGRPPPRRAPRRPPAGRAASAAPAGPGAQGRSRRRPRCWAAAPPARPRAGGAGRSSAASSTSTSRSPGSTTAEQGGQQGGLARAGAAADQERQPRLDHHRSSRHLGGQRAGATSSSSAKPRGRGTRSEITVPGRATGASTAWQPGAVGQPHVDVRRGVVEPAPAEAASRWASRRTASSSGNRTVGRLEAATAVEVDVVGAVDQHVGDAGRPQQRLERAGADDLAPQRLVDGEHGGVADRPAGLAQRLGDPVRRELAGTRASRSRTASSTSSFMRRRRSGRHRPPRARPAPRGRAGCAGSAPGRGRGRSTPPVRAGHVPAAAESVGLASRTEQNSVRVPRAVVLEAHVGVGLDDPRAAQSGIVMSIRVPGDRPSHRAARRASEARDTRRYR